MRWQSGRRSDNVEDRRGVRISRGVAGGRVVPDSLTHGTSARRVRWFRRGFESGELARCDTFSAREL
jgi:predicted metalloprotease